MVDLLAIVRALHFTATAMAAGAVIFRALVLGPAPRKYRAGAVLGASAAAELAVFEARLRLIAWVGLAVAILTGAAWLVVAASHMSERPVAAAIAEGDAWVALTQTHFGRAAALRFGLALLLAVLVPFAAPGSGRWIAAAIAAAFLGSIAWTGHAAATPDWPGDVHVIADAAHVIASGAWVGGLLPLAWLLIRARRSPDPSLAELAALVTTRFSVLGIGSVGILVATGLANTWFLAGTLPALVGTPYGRILLLKIAIFLAMLSFAAVNRRRLTPRLADAASQRLPAMRQLARNSMIELGLGGVAFALVGILGTLPPGAHEQPVWPFPMRLSGEALGIAMTPLGAFTIAAAVSALALLWVGTLWRLARWPMLIVGLALLLYAALGAGLFFEDAYPTSFYASPTRYAPTSIAQGHRIFENNCAGCHGADARGEPRATAAGGERLDLAGSHINAHPDGDLYWWITEGMGDAMPGFATILDDDARWNVIDFIHANADAARLRALAGKVLAGGYPAPNFSVQCGEGPSMTMEDLRGSIIHVIAAAGVEVPELIRLRLRDQAHGVRTVLIEPPSEQPADTEACVASDPSATETLAIYRGVPPSSVGGTELLIDQAELLRALWFPGAQPDWRDDDRFMRAIEGLRSASTSARATAEHAHH